jgi:hypothetical protein
VGIQRTSHGIKIPVEQQYSVQGKEERALILDLLNDLPISSATDLHGSIFTHHDLGYFRVTRIPPLIGTLAFNYYIC